TDIKDMKVVSRSMTLTELGMDSMMAVEIKQTLEREFDIFLTAQEIRTLTFAKLIKMSDRNTNDNIMDDKEKLGIEKLDIIKYLVGVVQDEDFTSQTCVDLSTKKQNTTTQVFLIPGLDGCGTVFNHLAPNIEFSAT
ncbi:PREDICTED: fatty acid synthase-like, partial [Wasmannia auropunctata]|uniref:fatty acid synthase-like n=1 Tax=Wasmannia auropunctata TaxID=64793 RepID=UPI0005F05EF2